MFKHTSLYTNIFTKRKKWPEIWGSMQDWDFFHAEHNQKSTYISIIFQQFYISMTFKGLRFSQYLICNNSQRMHESSFWEHDGFKKTRNTDRSKRVSSFFEHISHITFTHYSLPPNMNQHRVWARISLFLEWWVTLEMTLIQRYV